MSSSQDATDKVIVEQTLLKVEEVFVYRIPPCPTSGGHRADDWNLANPQATCSLIVLRRDSALLIRLYGDRPMKGGPPGATEKFLFAQCKAELDLSISTTTTTTTATNDVTNVPKPKMDFWVEAVVDSSRYFAIRISDENTGREAHVGMGFRERNDALNFKMSLQEYENMMRKEATVQNNNNNQSSSNSTNNSLAGGGTSNETTEDKNSGIIESITSISKLSLKEGEKIHVNIKGTTKSTRSKKVSSHSSSSSSEGKKAPMLLRKPPPAGSIPSASEVTVNTDVVKTSGTRPSLSTVQDVSSTIALAESADDDDDDEWGDFESVPSSV